MSKGSGGIKQAGNSSQRREVTEKEGSEILLNVARYYGDIKSVRFEKGDEDEGAAYTSSGDVIINSTLNNLYVDGKRINFGKEVRSALFRIQNNQNLTYRQELALSAINHEFTHNTSPWSRIGGATHSQVETMETVNEFISTMNFGTFMNRLGATSEYHTKIIRESPFYGSKALVDELRKRRISLNVVADALNNVHTTTSNPRSYKSKVIETLKSLGMSDAKEWWDKNIQ